ncbi:MAG TPA: GNAT family N-acetyltransferase [Candidatus Limnocylindria bacterium]
MTDLLTPRLRLRPMRAEDAQPLFALFGDASFMAAFDSPPFGMQQMDRWVARNLEHQRQHGYGLYTIELRETDEVIGDCGLEHMDLDGTPEVELGYDLRRDLWGRGLATEAAGAVARHACGELGMPRLVSLVRASNLASARVAAKIGMRRERELERDGARYLLFALVGEPGAD